MGGFGKLDDPGEGAMLVFVAMVERKLRKIKKAMLSEGGKKKRAREMKMVGME